MNVSSTLLLRGAIVCIGLFVLGLCAFALPEVFQEGATQYYFVPISMYAAAIPFYLALYQGMKLLSYIDKNNAFSDRSVKALRYIEYYALIISAIYVVSLPFYYTRAEVDDAPGLLAIGIVFTLASIIVAVFAALLRKLLKNVIDMKSENDLTV